MLVNLIRIRDQCIQSTLMKEVLLHTSNVFHHYLAENGIESHTSCAYTPEQNGVAERKN